MDNTGNSGGSASLMLGVGLFAFAVVVAVKTGSWYGDWREVAAIDADLANRQMLRAIRTAMSAISLVVLTAGAGVAWRGWQTVQAGGDDAVRFGWMLMGLASFGAIGLIAATWLIGEQISAPAVARKVATLREEARSGPQPYIVTGGKRAAANNAPSVDSEEDLRDTILLHCMPGQRSACTPGMQARIERFLYNGVRGGRSCSDLAAELGVPEPGVQPWCDDLSDPPADTQP